MIWYSSSTPIVRKPSRLMQVPRPRMLARRCPPPPRPRDVSPDGGPLGRCVEGFVPVVRQQGEAHLLVQQLRAEAVDHARGSGHVGLAQSLRAFAALEELARQHATVDEVDRRAPREQLARPELE